MSLYPLSRRAFFAAAAGSTFLAHYRRLAAAARNQLKIQDVRTMTIQGPSRTYLLVKVIADDGTFGVAEAYGTPGIGVKEQILSLKQGLLGKDPLEIDAIFTFLDEHAKDLSGTRTDGSAHNLMRAASGIEMALWDLAGKALGLPVYQLLGGKVRDRVRVYCDSGSREMIPGDEQSKARIQQIQDLGFTAAKIDIDDADDPARFDRVNWTASNGEIDHMVAKVAFTRELYPRNFDLAVDMHARYDVGTGKRVAREVEPFKLMFLEEPVPAENIDAMRDVRESTSTPICCGENVYLRWGFREILEKRAADIIMPDLQKCGGLLEGRKIADLAHTYYVPVAPHAVTSPIGMMATAHVCAAIPNFLAQEWHWIDSLDHWRNWVKEGDILQKGYITPPDRPGIGVEMNEDGARRAQVPGTPWFEPATRS